MVKILKTITEQCYNSKEDNFIKVGNYQVNKKYSFINHFYYGHNICNVSLRQKNFVLDSCGYKNSRLTTAQLNYLETFYKNKGFKLLARF